MISHRRIAQKMPADHSHVAAIAPHNKVFPASKFGEPGKQNIPPALLYGTNFAVS